MGVDTVAFVAMSAALLLGQNLAGAVVAVMYAGGNMLEDFAVARAERDLKSLVDHAPRVAHRRTDQSVEDVPINRVAIGDVILVRAGEVIPVDGVIAGVSATLDEAALTGEPIPVTRSTGDPVHSGTINAGETFELRATAVAGQSTYAGIVRMVTAAQTAKAPFIRELKGQRRHNAHIDGGDRLGVVRRNVFQVCDGGFDGRAIYFETVDWATSKPSIRSSP